MSTLPPSVESQASEASASAAGRAGGTPAGGGPASVRPGSLSVREWMTMVLIRPVRAVRNSDDAGWLWSWVAHLAGLVLGVMVVMLLEALSEAPGRGSPLEVMVAFVGLVDQLLHELTRGVYQAGLAVLGALGGLLFIHAGTAVAAVGLMGWTARADEPVRASWARAMQRLWRLTPHAAVIVLAGGLGLYLAEQISWMMGWSWWWVSELVFATVWSVMVGWTLAVVLGALTPAAVPRCCRWPAGCEGCGYPLLGLSAAHTCPECGVPVGESVAASRRPGPPWTRASGGGWAGLVERWWTSVTEAVCRPTRLGRSLHLLTPGHGHRTFFAGHLVLAWLSGFAGVAASVRLVRTLDEGPSLDVFEVLEVLVVMGQGAGTVTVAVGAAACIGGAAVVGSIASWVYGRNLLPAAQQAASYLAGYALLWVAILWALGLLSAAVLYILFEYLGVGQTSFRLVERILIGAWLGFLGLNALLLAGYLFLVARITRAVRHANW